VTRFSAAKPVAIDLYCGLGGWAEGFLAEGFECIGFDNERHDYGSGGYPGQLVLQDVLTLHGSQFRTAAVIVASPPCQAYSYRAMPWKRAKALPPPDNALFDACFRIQREASEASGIHIPLIVENVKGAQPWVGRAAWHYGSYYLWGDVPALMPPTMGLAGRKRPGRNFHAFENGLGSSPSFHGADHETRAVKTVGHVNKRDGYNHTRHLTNQAESDGIKQGGEWWHDPASRTRRFSSRSKSRKAASAQIAKIPFALAQHIALVFKPEVPTFGA
jgi:hypothetical protein